MKAPQWGGLHLCQDFTFLLFANCLVIFFVNGFIFSFFLREALGEEEEALTYEIISLSVCRDPTGRSDHRPPC